MNRAFALTAAALLTVACAKSEPAPNSMRSNVQELDLEQARQALEDAERRLGDTLSLAAADCPTARALRERICELSARLCALESAPGAASKGLCEDGKRRCEGARARVDAKCGSAG